MIKSTGNPGGQKNLQHVFLFTLFRNSLSLSVRTKKGLWMSKPRPLPYMTWRFFRVIDSPGAKIYRE